MKREKTLTIMGCSLWIIGLAMFIIGLNFSGDTRSWLTTIGSILFLIGLGITGALWMKHKKEE